MASTAVALQFRSKHRPIGNQTFVHLFSSSTSDSNSESTTPSSSTTPDKPSPLPQSPAQSQSTFSSYFSDVKASLKQQQPPKPFNFTPSTPPRPQNPPAKVASLEEIRKNLAEFRRRSNIPPPDKQNSSAPNSSQQVSFHELYQRNVVSRGEESMGNANKGGRLSFEAIRESLRQMKPRPVNNQAEPGGRSNQPMSFTRFQESLKMRPADPNAKEPPLVIGGSDKLPLSIFGKEIKEKKDPQSAPMKTEFVRTYSYAELGEKLRLLRPQTKDGEKIPFSLSELNERLMKLREMEEKESESRIGGVTFKDLRESLIKLQTSDDAKARNTSIQRLNVLGHLGATPSFMLQPPKEHLVEKYFHPDNMSSAEKLKLELEKVRDEFKMSESDCGSARVQVAQLTTKIKHLSTVLHKKDKHSRKGLLAMVQQRKKLLKYLRRTDWDSYCLVLSKLGLRDNPDFKN